MENPSLPQQLQPAGAGFHTTKYYDVLIAAPLIILYAFGIPGSLPDLSKNLRQLPSPLAALHVAEIVSNMFYFGLVIVIIVFRRMPVAKSDRIFPRALALAGAYLITVLKVLPTVSISVTIEGLSTLVTAGATLAEVAILFWLGRAFSLLPEARQLVTTGPYRWIRHPLYLAGLVGSLGVMLQFRQPWALLIVLVSFGLQLRRMDYEEDVLTRTFPEYQDYVARTSRLLPGVY
jgi:protein-S-isoprenylcysteine O-methyltransferase Ste14